MRPQELLTLHAAELLGCTLLSDLAADIVLARLVEAPGRAFGATSVSIQEIARAAGHDRPSAARAVR